MKPLAMSTEDVENKLRIQSDGLWRIWVDHVAEVLITEIDGVLHSQPFTVLSNGDVVIGNVSMIFKEITLQSKSYFEKWKANELPWHTSKPGQVHDKNHSHKIYCEYKDDDGLVSNDSMAERICRLLNESEK